MSPSAAIRRQFGGRRLKNGDQRIEYSRYLGSYLCPTAVIGTPALTLPIGFSELGLPIGVQIHARSGADYDLLAMAKVHLEKYTFA